MLWSTSVALLVLAAAALAHGATGAAGWVSKALGEAMPDYAPDSQTHAECRRHSTLYQQALSNNTLWAVQMLDSSSVSVGGILTGDMYSLGHYDQCLGVEVPGTGLRGQHCLATLRYGPAPSLYPGYYTPPNYTFWEPPPWASVWEKAKMTLDPSVTRRDLFHLAVCVPASCSPRDIQNSLNATLEPVFNKYGLRVEVSVDPVYCHTAEEQEVQVTAGYVTIRVALVLLGLLALSATLYDYIMPFYREEKFESSLAELSEKLFLAFSWRRNMHDLTEKGANPKLDIINGAKVISITAILFGHRALYSHGLALHNNQFWELRLENHFSDTAVMNATHLVDIFFLSSGYLAFLGIYKTLEKSKRINFGFVIFLRWLRIVPPYLLMMGVVGWLLPYLAEGPLWDKRVGLEAWRCQENWWLNLLFINNYVHADNQCMLLSWYLACDMQFFIIAIFAIYVLWRWPRVGYALFAFLFAVSVLVPFYVTYQGKYYGILRLYGASLLQDPFSNEHFNSVYVKSHNRAGPYILGILTGYLTIKLSETNYKFSKKTIFLVFVLLFGGGYAHQWYGWFFYHKDRPYDALENAFYAATHRLTFCVGAAWAAVTYYTTGLGLFKVFLAPRLFTPLCRLVYSLVLIHPVLQLAEAASVRHSEYMNYPKMLWMACGDYLVATLLSIPLFLTVEAPSRTIVKVLFLGESKPSKEKSQSQDQNQNQPAEPADQPKQVVISRL